MTLMTVSSDQKSIVELTDKASDKVRELLADFQSSDGHGVEDVSAAGLRIAVRGGGCSGFQYALAFDDPAQSDRVFEFDGVRILVDEESLPLVEGSTVDYVEGLQGAGFQVNNPNATASCGCGSSFRIDDSDSCSQD